MPTQIDLPAYEGALSSFLARFRVPGVSIALVSKKADGGFDVQTAAAGFRDVEAGLQPDADTQFCIGSCTKAMTAALLGMLKDEGKLDWGDPLRKHWPAFDMLDKYAAAHATVADALTHVTGLAGHDLAWYAGPGCPGKTTEAYCRDIAVLPSDRELRAGYEYNNLMYVLLGYLVEQISGKPWADFLRERLFAPLGMTRSHACISRMAADANAARGYRLVDGKVARIPYYNNDAMGGCGAVVSTANDLAKWVAFCLGDGTWEGRRILSETTMAELHAPRVVLQGMKQPHLLQQTYGFGWNVNVYRGALRIHHGGAIDGFGASVSFFPEQSFGIAALGNLDGGAAHAVGAVTLMDMALGAEGDDAVDWAAFYEKVYGMMREGAAKEEAALLASRHPDAKPSHDWDAYAGDYTAPGCGTLRVEARPDGLSAVYNGHPYEMEHLHYDTFLNHFYIDGARTPMTVTFQTDAAGKVAAAELPLEPRVGKAVRLEKADGERP